MFPLDDTIVAIASPPGGAARGIVRISGPGAIECLAGLFRRQAACGFADGVDAPRTSGNVVVGSLHLSELHSPIPCDVYLWCGRPACLNEKVDDRGCDLIVEGDSCRRSYVKNTAESATGVASYNGFPNKSQPQTPAPQPAPQVRSYTGQPVAEIHTIGSAPLLEMIVRAVCAAGARLAGPGEFTLRAFLAGRIDLTQAEAVLGVIDADDSAALAAALGQLAGGLARPLNRLRDDLLDLLAHVEAGLDFADEDLPFVTREELERRLAEAGDCVAAVQRQLRSRGEPVDLVRAVLVGRPNTGKSSLFNAMVGGAAALVSHHAGTTRDYLTADVDLDGVRCRLIDTAGMKNEPPAASHFDDAVDRAAQFAAETQRRSADVQVLCLDATRPLDEWERAELEGSSISQRRIVVLTKCDAAKDIGRIVSGIETSSVSGEGIETLRGELRQQAIAAAGAHGDVVASTAARCRESLRLAGQSLQRARGVAQSGQEELAAAEIRVALDELGKVVGAVCTDDILDRIFSRFCVGK